MAFQFDSPLILHFEEVKNLSKRRDLKVLLPLIVHQNSAFKFKFNSGNLSLNPRPQSSRDAFSFYFFDL